jgi:integrase
VKEKPSPDTISTKIPSSSPSPSSSRPHSSSRQKPSPSDPQSDRNLIRLDGFLDTSQVKGNEHGPPQKYSGPQAAVRIVTADPSSLYVSPQPSTPKILSDASLRRLAERVYTRSQSLASVRARVESVIIVCKWKLISPMELLQMHPDWAELLNDYVTYGTGSGLSPNSIHSRIFSMKKWLHVNGQSIDWSRVELPKTWKVIEDRIPTREELKRILSASNLEDRVLVEIAISSGLRREDIINLTFGQIEGLDEGGIATIFIRPAKTKGRSSFPTFLTPEASGVIRSYRRERMNRGEIVTGESPVLRPVRLAWKLKEDHKVLDGSSITQRWVSLLERAGLAEVSSGGTKKWHVLHFHTLRMFFKTWAELKGVKSTFIEFFMGHTSTIAQLYFARGARPPDEVLEMLRSEYAKAVPALEILSEEEKVQELKGSLEETNNDVKTLREDNEILRKTVKELRHVVMGNRRSGKRGARKERD